MSKHGNVLIKLHRETTNIGYTIGIIHTTVQQLQKHSICIAFMIFKHAISNFGKREIKSSFRRYYPEEYPMIRCNPVHHKISLGNTKRFSHHKYKRL